MEQPTASSMERPVSLRVCFRSRNVATSLSRGQGPDLDVRAWASSLGSVCLLQQLRLPANRQVSAGNRLLLLIRGW